jgi:SAM-dependent methyltransferase
MNNLQYGLLHTLRCLWAGQTLLRIRMNEGFSDYTLRGVVVDVGGGRSPDYFSYFKDNGVASITAIDQSLGDIDFEKDSLPYQEASVDMIVCANVLEHVYRYDFLVGEMYRILALGGTLTGFVPFLLQYHPDPHDYFRYTKEALVKIFTEAGFKAVTIRSIGGGPLMVNFNNIVLSVPRIVRPFLYCLYAGFDSIFLFLRPDAQERCPLGYIFSARK